MNKQAEAIARLKELLMEHPFGSASFKDKLSEYEGLMRNAFGHLEKPTERKK